METDTPKPPVEPVAAPEAKRPRYVNWLWLPVLAAAILGFIALKSPRGLARPAAPAEDPPTVAVARVTREDMYKTVTIPSEFYPYLEVELHAKVSGYVSQMNVDIGYKVESNQLLATLEVPELQDQLHNARAVEQKAMADYTNAQLIYNRLEKANAQYTNQNLIAQQDLDTAQANALSMAAAIAAAKADREKYDTLVKYTQITAPFKGVITRRYADPGALIQAGTASDTQSMPLVRLSDNYHLRMDFYVDVDDVKDIHLGDPVEVRVGSLGGRTFAGKISLCTYRVEEDTRKMKTEVEVANPDLELVPGMYATVILKLGRRPQVLAVPVQAVATGRKPTVLVVNNSGLVEQREVTTGLETPDKFEITSGLKEGELVLVGGHASARAGEKVEPKLVATETAL